MHYPEDDSDISRRQQPPAPTGNAQVTAIEQQQCFSSTSSHASNSIEHVGPPAENSSPTTQSTSQAAALGATTSSKATSRKMRSKGSPPLSVTQQGIYYQPIKVYFDELHRGDVSRLGEPPSMRDLDTRQFLNKDVYDNLLHAYIEMSIAADHIVLRDTLGVHLKSLWWSETHHVKRSVSRVNHPRNYNTHGRCVCPSATI